MGAGLVEILQERAEAIAEGISIGLWAWGAPGYYGGSWRQYRRGERLQGFLIADDAVMYQRPHKPEAKLWLTVIRAEGVANVEFGQDSVVQADIIEKEHDHWKVKSSGTVVTETIEHTFDHLTTRRDTYTQQLRVAFEESLRFGGEKSKIGGGLKAEQELITAFEQQYGSQDDNKDVVRRTVSVAGPRIVDYEAIRRSQKVEQPVSVNANLSFQVNIDDETQISTRGQTWWEVLGGKQPPTTNRVHLIWESLDTLLAVFRGEAPIGLPLSPQFTEHPLDAGLVAVIEKKPEHANWVNRFSEVQSLDIDIEDETVVDLGNPDLIPLNPNVNNSGG